MEKSAFELLPEDLVVNIWKRLPLIDYFRLRCVCKALNSLLSDPLFMYKHLTTSDDSDYDQVIINHYNPWIFYPYGSRNDVSLISLHSHHSKTQLDVPDENKYFRCLTIVGSYNGLVCLTDNAWLILVWDPLTQETRELPMSPYYDRTAIFERPYAIVPFEVGFCFDANANDYKVIKVFHLPKVGYGPNFYGDKNTVFLYSFLSGLWTELDVSFRLGSIYKGVHEREMIRTPINSCEKFYHWVADPGIDLPRSWDDFSFVVLSFDMDLQLFKTTEIPYTTNYHFFGGQTDNDLVIGFFMLKEYVAISASPVGGPPVYEISVLVKVGVKESWTKLITIGPITDAERILNPWRNGKLFVCTCKGEVKIFDPFTGQLVVVSSNGRPPRHNTELMIFKGSQRRIRV